MITTIEDMTERGGARRRETALWNFRRRCETSLEETMETSQFDSRSRMVEHGLMAFALALLVATFLSWEFRASFQPTTSKSCNLDALSGYAPLADRGESDHV
jgi:hypothetical protein